MVRLPAFDLLASAARSSSQSGLGDPVTVSALAGAAFELRVSNAPSTSGSATASLDVYLLHTVDGTNYDAFAHFPQVTSSESGIVMGWNGLASPSTSNNFRVASTSALAASTIVHGPTGGTWKAAYTIANAPDAASSSAYTFSLKCQPYAR